MADASGDLIRGYPFIAISGLTKTATAMVVGNLLFYDTDGWGPISAGTEKKPFGVALLAVAATAAQEACSVFVQGAIRLLKAAGAAIAQGQGIMPTNVQGTVKAWDGVAYEVGFGVCIATAASAAVIVDVLM